MKNGNERGIKNKIFLSKYYFQYMREFLIVLSTEEPGNEMNTKRTRACLKININLVEINCEMKESKIGNFF